VSGSRVQPDQKDTERHNQDTPFSGTQIPSTDDLSVRIMIIDDSKTIRRSAESLLAREGWHVITAVDGFDALGKVVKHQPHIVFVDIMMPRLDGYQTCALIKNNAQFNKVPVIMLSSKDSIFDKAKGRVVGSEHYLTKPFTREDLINTIHKHVPQIQDAVLTG